MGGRRSHPVPGRKRAFAILLAIPLVLDAARVHALPVAEGDPAALAAPSARYPHYRARLDWPLVAVGAGTLAASFLVSRDRDPVPPEGLDPAAIHWGFDRDIVGHRDKSADTASDLMRNVSIAFPLVVAFASSPGGERLAETGRRSALYAEVFLVGQGIVRLGKTGIGRPRPFTYLADGERPVSAHYDATIDRAFRSMPSGHAATAWSAAGVGITEHLLTRPHASSLERLTVSALGGALAGGTSVLRVKAGQHFPTDVVAGGAIGLTLGVTIPLLHRGDRPRPSRRALLEAAGGIATGALIGGVVASAL